MQHTMNKLPLSCKDGIQVHITHIDFRNWLINKIGNVGWVAHS